MSTIDEVKRDIQASKKIRLPWWMIVFGIPAVTLAAWFFDSHGKLNLAAPILDGLATIAFTVVVKWKLRRQAWFWIVMAVFLVIHLTVLPLIPWTSRWVPAVVIAPFMCLDFCVMLLALTIVRKVVAKQQPDFPNA